MSDDTAAKTQTYLFIWVCPTEKLWQNIQAKFSWEKVWGWNQAEIDASGQSFGSGCSQGLDPGDLKGRIRGIWRVGSSGSEGSDPGDLKGRIRGIWRVESGCSQGSEPDLGFLKSQIRLFLRVVTNSGCSLESESGQSSDLGVLKGQIRMMVI